MPSHSRRHFMTTSSFGAFSLLLPSSALTSMEEKKKRFSISLAQWSLHRSLQSGQLNHLDFAKKAASFGIYAIEYVNTFFKDKAGDAGYLAEMNRRAEGEGVKQLLIMIDGEGGLAEPDPVVRKKAVENHYKWVEAARTLGCHSIRVNAYGASDDPAVLHDAAVEGLGALALFAKSYRINVIVENHGGYSSDGQWLSAVMRDINMRNCGTLPDFGNFCIRRGDAAKGEKGCVQEYDRYQGVAELLPFAKAVSAKSYDFDADGHETTIDFARMMALVKDSRYSGYLGIEYEGSGMGEDEGIMATKKLLERLIA